MRNQSHSGKGDRYMDLLIRPCLFNLATSITQIDELLSGPDLSFALFLSTDRLLVANRQFIKRWDLHRISFPRYSLSDFGNSNALTLSGTTKGKFWNWFSEEDSNLSIIDLPVPHSNEKRILLRVPTEREGAGDPFFLEKVTSDPSEEQREGIRLLGRRLRSPARTIVRAFRDSLVLDAFFKETLSLDPFHQKAEVVLAKEAKWSPGSSFWSVRESEGEAGKIVSGDRPDNEGNGLVPFRRILFSKDSGNGFWSDFPLLLDSAFFGKIRLYRPESGKKELPGLKGFQKSAQELSRHLFNIRKNLVDIDPLEREPDTDFLSRKASLHFLESLIEEYRVSETGFGLVGIKVDLSNHREFMMKVRKVCRYYDEVGHLTPREYLLILPAMKPGSFDGMIRRIRDLLLGTNSDLEHFLSIGYVSFPESHKGPMNLIRNAFLREENQPIQRAP
jgi:hypothetical protein